MELSGNVQGLIDLVGGGSNVNFEQVLESGEKIGVITIDNVPTDIYAPAGAEVEVTQVLSSGTKIASIEVDGESVDLYAPTPEVPPSVEVTQVLSSGVKIASIEVDGVDTDLYAPEGGSSIPNYSSTPVKTGRKWIDGGDIWEVVLRGTISNASQTVDLSALDIKDVISVRGMLNGVNATAGYQITFPYYESNSYYSIYTKTPAGDMFISSSNAIVKNYNDYNIILEYTVNNS